MGQFEAVHYKTNPLLINPYVTFPPIKFLLMLYLLRTCPWLLRRPVCEKWLRSGCSLSADRGQRQTAVSTQIMQSSLLLIPTDEPATDKGKMTKHPMHRLKLMSTCTEKKRPKNIQSVSGHIQDRWQSTGDIITFYPSVFIFLISLCLRRFLLACTTMCKKKRNFYIDIMIIQTAPTFALSVTKIISLRFFVDI